MTDRERLFQIFVDLAKRGEVCPVNAELQLRTGMPRYRVEHAFRDLIRDGSIEVLRNANHRDRRVVILTGPEAGMQTAAWQPAETPAKPPRATPTAAAMIPRDYFAGENLKFSPSPGRLVRPISRTLAGVTAGWAVR